MLPGALALASLLPSPYGGIVEELQLRLLLMTLMPWTAARHRAACTCAAVERIHAMTLQQVFP